MSPFLFCYQRLAILLKQFAGIKLFAFITISVLFYFVWSAQYKNDELTEFAVYSEITEEAIQDVSYDAKFAELYRKKSHLPKDVKYILLWTADDYYPFDSLGKLQRQFIKHNCSKINCYVTSDRTFFGQSTQQFHAIAFNGRNIRYYTEKDLPKYRSPHQKYIYFNTESAYNYPICSKFFDNFFNWTATYKLNSDILYNYIIIKDVNGNNVGPKQNMKWVETREKLDNDLADTLRNKSKAAAWFVSNCKTSSKREDFVFKLQKALQIFNRSLDIYGSCGPFKCPKHRKETCDSVLERDYFFYLSFENSFSEDYVTEKLLTAMQHDIVPIVYGGANYSRFLPPGSYIDGSKYVESPVRLAEYMDRLIRSPKSYQQFFKWKKHYTYDYAGSQNVCNVCEALNDINKYETHSVYNNFTKWWNVREQPENCAGVYKHQGNCR